MKKKIFSTIVFTVMLFTTPIYLQATELSEEPLEKELIPILRGPIFSVIGVDWFSGSERILDIEQDDVKKGSITVKVRVVSFQGPHNPPYIEEIITFRINKYIIKPIDYYNRIIPENEWKNFNIP